MTGVGKKMRGQISHQAAGGDRSLSRLAGRARCNRFEIFNEPMVFEPMGSLKRPMGVQLLPRFKTKVSCPRTVMVARRLHCLGKGPASANEADRKIRL